MIIPLTLAVAAALSVIMSIAEITTMRTLHVYLLRLNQLSAYQRIKPFNTVFHNINPFYKIRIHIHQPAGAALLPMQAFLPSVRI